MAEREVRYCTTEDGVRIAYCVEGGGPPLLAMPFFIESFSLDHLLPEFRRDLKRIAHGRRLIRFDTRGTGLSDRTVSDMSSSALLRDAEAVVRALNLESFSLWGNAVGGVRAIEYAATHPDNVDRLILWATYATVSDAFSAETLRGFAGLARSNWDFAVRTLADLGSRRDSEEMGLRLAALYKESTSGEIVANLFESNIDTDLTPLLSQIRAITVVIHATNDTLYPISLAQKLAAGIPDAQLIPLEGDSNALWVGPDDVVCAAYAFLNDGGRPPPLPEATLSSGGAFRSIIFTDVVENTALLRRIGDDGWRAVMREHEEIVRAALKEHGGAEISTSGDGFFASFGSSVRALQCAVEMQRAFARRNETAEHPVEVRIGLNAGEPIEEGKEVLGTAVTMAARIMSQAGGGEILVSDVLRQLVAGKGFLFADRGEFVAKGFEEPVRVYEVRWGDG